MKAIDIIVFVLAILVVGVMVYRSVKKHYERKRKGIIGCGGGCSGCSHVDGCGLLELTAKYKKK